MKTLFAAAFVALATPVAAAPWLPQPAPPVAEPPIVPVQVLPPDYPYDPCAPGAPPVQTVAPDRFGVMRPIVLPPGYFCRRGVQRVPPGGWGPPPQAWDGPPPGWRGPPPAWDGPPPPPQRPPPPIVGYDRWGNPIFARPLPPGWHQDPYTGRSQRLLN